MRLDREDREAEEAHAAKEKRAKCELPPISLEKVKITFGELPD